MSQLSEHRRKVLKMSQEALATQLGYEKWQTYAAQESGRNPLPEDIKAVLKKKFKFQGEWPDEEGRGAEAGTTPAGLAREVVKLEGRVETLERENRALHAALALVKDLDERLQKLERRAGSRE